MAGVATKELLSDLIAIIPENADESLIVMANEFM
jgi:hypothetical protein